MSITSRRVLGTLAFALLVSAPASRGDDKLAFLIPHLYGPTGLVVDSEARLPNGQTHSAHFNSAFQAEFTQFNVAIASQLTGLPIPTPASGFTYILDPGLGLFTRSTKSFGPILADRADTVGRHKLSVGVHFQRFTFDKLEGVGLDDVPAVFTHDNPVAGTGRDDVVTTTNAIDASVSQLTTYLNFGVTSWLDLAVAVPLVTTDLSVRSTATVRRIGTSANPAIHFFRDASGAFGDTKSFESTGSASGVGDVVVRLKARAASAGPVAVGLGVDSRLPSGDEMDLLGAGAWGVKPFLVVSPWATSGMVTARSPAILFSARRRSCRTRSRSRAGWPWPSPGTSPWPRTCSDGAFSTAAASCPRPSMRWTAARRSRTSRSPAAPRTSSRAPWGSSSTHAAACSSTPTSSSASTTVACATA